MKMKKILSMLLAVTLVGGIWNLDVHGQTPDELVRQNPLSIMSTMRTSAPGVQLFSEDNVQIPELKEGNYIRWIDRVELPEYALSFYEQLEEGTDNDGIDDFLIDPESSSLVKEMQEYVQDQETATSVKGVGVVGILGTGEDWNQALDAVYEDFTEKYYNICTAYEAFDRDHAEIFWLNGSSYISVSDYEYSQEYDKDTGKTFYVCTGEIYFMVQSEGYEWDIRYDKYKDPDVIRTTIEMVNTQAQNIVSAVSDKEPVEQIQYFNEWLTTNNEYNYLIGHENMDVLEVLNQLPDSFECTAALTGMTGEEGPVCESYACAFKVLCDRAQIPCVLVSGFALNGSDEEGESHIWNYAEVEGNWYAIDVTWNDPLWGDAGAVSGKECEDYLLVGADTETMVGSSQMRFIDSHPATNQLRENGVSFTNGPILSSERYIRTIESLTVTATVEELEFGYTVNPLMTAEVIAAEGQTEEPVYFWYEVDENGTETLIEGANTNTLEFPAGRTGGTYTYRVKATLGGNTKQADIQIKVEEPEISVTDIFNDVRDGSWYEDAVQYVYDKGLMEGNGDKFTPNGQMTRGMFVTTLYRLAGEPELTEDDRAALTELHDVAQNAWYTDAVCWAYANEITTGYLNDRTFRTNVALSREQLATFVYRYAQYQGLDISVSNDLADLLNADKVKPYAEKEVKWAVGAGIINGMEVRDEAGNTVYDLAPQKTATRAQMAQILRNFCEAYHL